jgi:hypothetical protein
VRAIPAYKAGLYGLTENRQLSESNSKPPFIPVHGTGFSGCLNKLIIKMIKRESGGEYIGKYLLGILDLFHKFFRPFPFILPQVRIKVTE